MDGLLPNTSLSHYRIVSKIGLGGMDEVYLAQDTKLNCKVALKILPAEAASNRDRMQRFTSEATIRGLLVRLPSNSSAGFRERRITLSPLQAGSKSDLGSEPSKIL
jgi:serine/threonine protein kinase